MKLPDQLETILFLHSQEVFEQPTGQFGCAGDVANYLNRHIPTNIIGFPVLVYR